MKPMFAKPRIVLLGVFVLSGCGPAAKEKSHDFFTSGSHEADQRADQRMAKTEQLRGSGEGGGEKASAKVTAGGKTVVKADELKSLYDRLGGEKSIVAIVEDFVPRALADPRVNWERKGVKMGGFTVHRGKLMQWNASPENVAQLKKHIVQFISLSTGGPAYYDGREMKEAHENRHISNAEFDAAIGDLKASLDKLQVPNKEQKELLAIVESTRPQVVQDR
ncbi:MAG: globin-like protein [Phycisphaerales bacterium]|nr:globin-like protein [Phycisphaerales bacterium]